MNQFRARWPDRGGFILAMAGVSLGLGVVRHAPVAVGGVQLLMWLAALVSLVIPMTVLELAIGVIFQGAAAESLRKSDKRLEWLGWLAAGVAFLALVAAGATVGDLGVSAYDSVLATLADQPLPWSAQFGKPAAQHHAIGAVLLAVAAVMALIDLRLWRGAPSIARTAMLTVPIGMLALAALLASLAVRPGAIDGVARWLSPGDAGWSGLLSGRAWLEAYAYALSTWMLGLGIYTAFGSYLNRSSDVTGITGVAVLSSAGCQVVLMLVVHVASGLASGPLAGAADQPAGFAAVPMAIANLATPPWMRGALAVLWFVALLAFAMPALLALAEAVVAPIADKFRVARERVVASVCLAAFFCAALVAMQRGHPWLAASDAALLAAAAALVAVQALAAWWKVDLDALQRHLNAYSAFRVGIGWRVLVAGLVPVASLALAADRIGSQLAARALDPAAGAAAAAPAAPGWIAVAIVAGVGAVAWVVARLPARGA
jgi:NSS family neurotransmitter:Na+ symporter